MATVNETPKASVLPHVIRDIVTVYGLTILSAIAVNWIVRTVPIGPWSGAQVEQFFWLDNIAWQLFALWWIILIAVSDFWPFNGLKPGFTRGLTIKTLELPFRFSESRSDLSFITLDCQRNLSKSSCSLTYQFTQIQAARVLT